MNEKIDSFLLKHPFWYYVKRHPRSVAVGMASLLITNSLDASYPLILKAGLDQIEKRAALSELGRTAAIFFAVMVLLAVTRYGWRLGFGYFHSNVAEHIRQTLFRHLTQMGPKFFNKNPVGELMSLLTADVQSFRQAVGPGLLILADAFMVAALVLPIMFSLNAEWTLKTLVFLPLVPFLIWKVLQLIHKRYKIQQEKFSELTAFAQENIGGIRVVKSFALEERRSEQFDKLSAEFETSCNRVARVDGLFGPVMEFGVASGSVILLFVAQNDVVTGVASIGTFVAFHRYIQKMVWPMTAIGMGLSMFQKGWASFDRISAVLKQESNVQDNGQLVLEKVNSIEFRDVSFQYPDAKHLTLEKISFKILKGQSLGILGPVGAGKTTLLNLLARLYPPDTGQIYINDIPIENFTLKSLRNHVILIPQEPFLFSDTVEGNLAFGVHDSHLSPGERDTLLKTVDLSEEISQLPEKELSLLGERGVNLSGGQKQRLAIARGLACNSSVLVLDDALSAVDTKTENRIESLLSQHPAHTKIVIAHRLSSLKKMTHLLVLKEGRLEAFGPTAEVSRQSETYKTVHAMQSQATVDTEMETVR